MPGQSKSTIRCQGIRPEDRPFNAEQIRQDFPNLHVRASNQPLVYLDNAATTHKPAAVIEAIVQFYTTSNANIHRAVHALGRCATDAYEQSRAKIQAFIGAREPEEIIFVRGATEATNLVAQCIGMHHVSRGDEILVTEMEHHSNIVPWQMLCERTGAVLKHVPVTEEGELCIESFSNLLSSRTKLVAVAHVSNAIGTINPVEKIVELAHGCGAVVIVDGAQAMPHLRVNVEALGCDFYAFSGHKMFGPTGIGVLWGKREWLEQLPPYQGGGEMVQSVSFDRAEYAKLPHRLEAGTPNIAGAIGLGAAVEYLSRIDFDALRKHEADLLQAARAGIAGIPGVKVLGMAEVSVPIISFTIDGMGAHDIASILDQNGIAVRSGHHCAQPLLRRFGCEEMVRASFAFYNLREEVDVFVAGVEEASTAAMS